MRSINFRILSIFIICCLGIILYSNTFRSSFHFDDKISIVENLKIRNLFNLKEIWKFWPSRFVLYLTFAVNYYFGKLDVFGYHLLNLITHLGAAIAVWGFVLLLFSTPQIKNNSIAKHANLIAFFAGIIFLAHPIQTQSAVYIYHRSASLVALFYLLSLSFYVKSRLSDSKIYYIGSLITAIITMFTKEIAVTLPLIVLLIEPCFLKSNQPFKWKNIIPFFIIALIVPLTLIFTKSVSLENAAQLRMVSEPFFDIGFSTYPRAVPVTTNLQYLFTQMRVIVTYLRLLILPVNQNFDYYYPILNNFFALPVLSSFLLEVFIIAAAIKLFSKYRLVSFGIFWFFITLLPESSIIPIQDVIFEHRLYLPMAGFSIFLASSLYYLVGRKSLRFMIVILLVLVAGYSVLTYQRNFVWKNEFSLWDDVIKKSPQKARGYVNRSIALRQTGEYRRAIKDCDKAIKIDPDLAQGYSNRGKAYEILGEINQAVSDYSKAIKLDAYLVSVYNLRGRAYEQMNDLDLAIQDFNTAITINPNLAEAFINRARIYEIKGNLNQAISDYNRAVAIDPDAAGAFAGRGIVYYLKGNLSQAISDYSRAIQLDPNLAEAYYNRAVAFFMKEEYNKAWQDAQKAKNLGSEIDPGFLENLKKAKERINQ